MRILPPARYRHPGDVIRLSVAGLVLAGAAVVTSATHATYAGASDFVVTALRPSTVAGRALAGLMQAALVVAAIAAVVVMQHALRALTLLGAVDAAWSATQIAVPNTLREQHDTALATARALPGSSCEAAFTEGNAMSQAEAIALALGESSPPASGSPALRSGEIQPPLTSREQDVAALVAQGMSNSQIAATLVISARTVETHVQHIMDKLGCRTRAQIAAWSAARPQGPSV